MHSLKQLIVHVHALHTYEHNDGAPLDCRVPKLSSLSRKQLVDPAGATFSADNGSDTQ